MLAQYILVPLYIYPSSSNWSPPYNALSQYPNLLFSVVINPSSGPGGKPGTVPNGDWIEGISKLNGYNNSQLLGYVHTINATRPLTNVTSDIDTYAAWANYTHADLHMDGIFFDEAPGSIANPTTRSFMKNITSYARDHPYLGGNVLKGEPSTQAAHITLNPGIPVDNPTTYYGFCDTMLCFEDYFAQFSTSTTAYPWPDIPTDLLSKSAFLLHDFPAATAKANTSLLQSTVNTLVSTNGVGGVYITSKPDYNEWGVNWATFVADVDVAAGGNGSAAKTSGAAGRVRPFWGLVGPQGLLAKGVKRTWFSGAK